MGCRVAGVIVLVDRQEGAREALHEVYGDQVPFFPLLTKADILGSSRAPGTEKGAVKGTEKGTDSGAEGQPSEVW
jgi:orotate phosphoribosyltransferase